MTQIPIIAGSNEEWRIVEGYDAGYEVSSFGRVRSYKIPRGRGTFNSTPRLLSVKIMKTGYLSLGLRHKRKHRSVLVHQLVIRAFHPETWFEGAETNHIDGDKKNNYASNLEWVTRSRNALHAFELGLRVPTTMTGSETSNAKLSDDEVQRVLWLFHVALCSTVELAREFGVSHWTIADIVRGKTWPDSYKKFPANLIRPKGRWAVKYL